MDWYFYLIIVILMLFSAFFSTCDTVYATVDQDRLNNAINRGSRKAKYALEIAKDYEFDYIINTQVAQSRILKGMGETYLDNALSPLEEVATVDVWQQLYQELTDIIADEDHQLNLYWTIL